MKLTTKKLKQLIREELSMINEKEMINELFGPDNNLSVQDIQAAFKEIAEKEKHKSGWMYQLMNLKYAYHSALPNYSDWKDALLGDGILYYYDRNNKFDPKGQVDARVIHADALELATQKKKGQEKLPMSENRKRRIKRK